MWGCCLTACGFDGEETTANRREMPMCGGLKVEGLDRDEKESAGAT